MKKITLFTVCIAIVSTAIFLGCKKKRITVEYDMNYSTSYVLTPATTTIGTNYFWTPVTTNIGSSLDNNKMNGNIVGEITLTNFSMNIKGPSGTDVRVLKAYEFWMKAGTQKEVRVAYCKPWVSDVPTTTLTTIAISPTTGVAPPIVMKLEGTNLKNYFLESRIDCKFKTWPTNTLSATYTINTTYTVHVKGIN